MRFGVLAVGDPGSFNRDTPSSMTASSPVHFISGLPRAGSTLLAALLSQNPKVLAHGRISPVAPMIIRLSGLMAEGEYASDFSEEQRKRLLRGVLEDYYHPQPDQIVLDTSREWCTRLALIDRLYPKARVICCVRDPVWILDSLERLIVRDPILSSRLVPITQRSTQHDRLDHLLSREGVFGYAWRVLMEAFHGPFADKLILVDYQTLATNPRQALEKLTRCLGLPAYPYDLNNVTNRDTKAFDSLLGTPDLHRIRPVVSHERRHCILPPDVIARMQGGMFWREASLHLQSKAQLIA